MQAFPDKKLPLSILFIPVFSMLGYLAANSAFFTQPYQEIGDYAANALQILKAGEFQETLGAYSRFIVNHPGPIVFYYLSWMEKIFFFVKSPHGAHSIAIVLYNLALLIISLKILYSRTEDNRSSVFLLISLLIGLNPLLPGIFSNIWGPGVIILPTLLFLIALADFTGGSIRNFFWLTVAANLIVQNQIVGISFVFPLLAISIFYFYKSYGFAEYKSREFLIIVLSSIVFTILCWLPPLLEEFSHSPGNITKVLTLALKNSTFHKIGPTLSYVLSYYTASFAFLKEIPALLVVGLLFGIPQFAKNGLQDFDKRLLTVLFWAFGLTLLGGFKMKGGQISHIYWFTYIIASLLIYLNIKVFLSKIEFPDDRSFYWYFAILSFLCFALYGKNSEFKYDDRVDKLVEAISPQKENTYRILWKSNEKDFKQGDIGVGIVLKLARGGYKACLNEEWHFLVRDSFRCSDAEPAITLTLETPDIESETFQTISKDSFVYRSTSLRMAK
ncbi:hypothetical protein EHO59_01495 [Leptospira semungkisensis]|uniref:Glycosyltransferase RgtA/B/C/D-like domain-containing protein n=1 Tax=Leptospira semungkisensis TaxID=2484985 RepID=A0A4R9G5I7_9LEPT|nr:hypothetical protein [Leptospira semungkisensis]TGK06826.1 hypothetical protein EHO59_01495 [Leptospira semungkisensis]